MPRRKKIEEPIEEVKKIKTPSLAKGMKDIVPSDNKYWKSLIEYSRNLAEDFSFVRIDTPIVQKFELYTHALGRNHELVKKQGIIFQEKNEKVMLRPDFTPSIARSYVHHGFLNQAPPNKYWYGGKVFSQGDYYSHKSSEVHQIGYEVYNTPSPAVDAELVVVLYHAFEQMGLKPRVRVNSLGCLGCRNEYYKALTAYIKSKRSGVCAECRSKATRDPLSFIKCTSQKCKAHFEDAPQVVDYLCEKCHSHLFKFLEALDEVKVDYLLDPKEMRDMDYYSSTIYSIYNRGESEDGGEEKMRLLAMGGRFNNLVEMLGGEEIAGAGIKFIVENVVSIMKENKVEAPVARRPQIYFAQLSEQAKRKAMVLVEELRAEDYRVVANFSKDSLRAQLDSATKMGAKIILILGQREVVDGTIQIRDTDSGIQEVINQKKLIADIKKKMQLKSK